MYELIMLATKQGKQVMVTGIEPENVASLVLYKNWDLQRLK